MEFHARKLQGKSVSSYLHMNINDLGAIAMIEFCSLKYLIFVYASIQQNIARKSQGKSVSSYLFININDLGAMTVHRTQSHPFDSTTSRLGFIRHLCIF